MGEENTRWYMRRVYVSQEPGQVPDIQTVKECAGCPSLVFKDSHGGGWCLTQEKYMDNTFKLHQDCPLPEGEFSMRTNWIEEFDETAPGFTDQIKKTPTAYHYSLHWEIPAARKEDK